MPSIHSGIIFCKNRFRNYLNSVVMARFCWKCSDEFQRLHLCREFLMVNGSGDVLKNEKVCRSIGGSHWSAGHDLRVSREFTIGRNKASLVH